jgi:flavin reductase (DIM6/NTAB) family NADH-FMN oxidoreductase RutF
VSSPSPSAPADGGSAEAVAGPSPARWSTPATSGDFRRAVGRFATGICVVSTVADGLDHAMTVNAFTSVSLDPLLVLICVETDARFCDAVLSSGRWAVSILDARARPAADWLATRGRPLQGQLEAVPHRRGPATGAAVLESASAWLECRTHAVHPGGDHLIVVGEVLSVGLGADDSGALLYHRSAYRKLD